MRLHRRGPSLRIVLACSALIAPTCASATRADDPLPLQGRHVAGLPLTGGAVAVAHIAAPTRVQYFVGQNERWKPTAVTIGAPLLVPGAPLALVAIEGEELPKALSIGAGGHVIELTPRQAGPEAAPVAESLIPSAIEFPPGGEFTIAPRSRHTCLFGIARDGLLWEFDPSAGGPVKVEGRAGRLLPGGAVRTLPGECDELFLVDRRGNLVSYVRDPIVRWKGPRLIGTGFVAGGDVVAWRRPDGHRDAQVASVNAAGELLVGRLEPYGWKIEIAPGWVLPPGTPVGSAHTPVNLRLCAVSARGTLPEMTLVNTEWRERPIASGFAWRSSVVFIPSGPVALGVDIAGNLISAAYAEEVWTSSITTTDPAVETARLEKREWNRSPAAPPVEIELVNRSENALIVRLGQRLHPAGTIEKTIAPQGTLKVELQSDSPGELVDRRRFTAADGTKTEQVMHVPTPPQGLYDVEVLTARENAMDYIELRQNPWPPAPRREKSPVSVGNFAIPPSGVIPAGARVDLLQSAESGGMSIIEP